MRAPRRKNSQSRSASSCSASMPSAARPRLNWIGDNAPVPLSSQRMKAWRAALDTSSSSRFKRIMACLMAFKHSSAHDAPSPRGRYSRLTSSSSVTQRRPQERRNSRYEISPLSSSSQRWKSSRMRPRVRLMRYFSEKRAWNSWKLTVPLLSTSASTNASKGEMPKRFSHCLNSVMRSSHRACSMRRFHSTKLILPDASMSNSSMRTSNSASLTLNCSRSSIRENSLRSNSLL
mmetsp:Transcript_49949/g.88779  ORF Transcript_49949/g.88779 Transcript_49949/m.88779 type:complete len:233 (+) Transcript_49949:2110-2808(+)